MGPIVFLVLIAVSLGAVGMMLLPAFAGNSRADKRRKALKGDYQVNRQNVQAERERVSRRKSVQQVLQAQSGKPKKSVPLKTKIFQAGMSITKAAFIRNSVILGVIVFALCFLFEVPLLFSLIFGLTMGYVAPRFYLVRRRKKFQAKFLDELPNAVEAIVRGVKSGMPLNDSFRIVAKEVKEPVRTEFARILDQQSFGKSMMEAIHVLYERVPLAEVNFFVVVITVQQQAGGNLSEALGNLSRVLRNRKKIQNKIKAMSSEAKASSMIIGSLPFIVGILISLVSPGYLSPLFTTPIGNLWLGVGAFMMCLGGFIMNRMIQFDY